jgi:hypothetical protein
MKYAFIPLVSIFVLISCDEFGDTFETRFKRPHNKPIVFIKPVDFGIQVEIKQNQDSTKNEIAIGSTFKIKVSSGEITQLDFLLTIKRNSKNDNKVIIRRRYKIDLIKTETDYLELANGVNETFSESDVKFSIISINNKVTNFSGFFSGQATGYKSGVPISASLSDVIIDYKGQLQFDLQSSVFSIKSVEGILISNEIFVGDQFSGNNEKLGTTTGRLEAVTDYQDSLRIITAPKNTSDIDSIFFKLNKQL